MADAHVLVQGRLVAAWFRRKRLEARLIANEVGRLFGGEPAVQEMSESAAEQERLLASLGIAAKQVEVQQVNDA